MKRSKIFATLIALILLSVMLLPTSAVGANSSEYNVALNKPVYLSGIFFTGGWGGGLAADPQTITDGDFFPRGQQWDQGPVWWDSTSIAGQSISINLQGLYEISSFVVQADDNDAYQLYYYDFETDSWEMAWAIPNYDIVPDPSNWGMQTRPNPDDDTERYTLPSPIVTGYLKLVGNDADSFDRLYAISEIQAYGHALKCKNPKGAVKVDLVEVDVISPGPPPVTEMGDVVGSVILNTTASGKLIVNVNVDTEPNLEDYDILVHVRYYPLPWPFPPPPPTPLSIFDDVLDTNGKGQGNATVKVDLDPPPTNECFCWVIVNIKEGPTIPWTPPEYTIDEGLPVAVPLK